MKILAFDQASKCGWSFFRGNHLMSYGVEDFSHIDDYFIRINYIKNHVKQLVGRYNPQMICFEDIQFQSNQNVFKKLANLQGALIDYCIENNILYEIVPPSRWRSYCKINGRKRTEQKEQAKLFCLDKYDLVVDDNIAEAICIGLYATNNIIVIE